MTPPVLQSLLFIHRGRGMKTCHIYRELTVKQAIYIFLQKINVLLRMYINLPVTHSELMLSTFRRAFSEFLTYF